MAKVDKVVKKFLKTELTAFTAAHRDMEAGIEGSVHAARVACRRMRSIVQSARPLWAKKDHDVVKNAQDTCRIFAGQLSGARDTEALLELVHQWAQDEEWDQRSVDSVIRAIESYTPEAPDEDAELVPTEPVTAADLIAAVQAVIELPFPNRSALSAPEGLPIVLTSASGKVLNRMAFAAGELNPDAHLEALHDVRKACKRLRYVTEMASPHLPAAKELAVAAKKVQTSMGVLQDHEELLLRLSRSRTKGAQLVRAHSQEIADTAAQTLPERIQQVLQMSLRVAATPQPR